MVEVYSSNVWASSRLGHKEVGLEREKLEGHHRKKKNANANNMWGPLAQFLVLL